MFISVHEGLNSNLTYLPVKHNKNIKWFLILLYVTLYTGIFSCQFNRFIVGMSQNVQTILWGILWYILNVGKKSSLTDLPPLLSSIKRSNKGKAAFSCGSMGLARHTTVSLPLNGNGSGHLMWQTQRSHVESGSGKTGLKICTAQCGATLSD